MLSSISATLWPGWMVMDGVSPSSILVKVAMMEGFKGSVRYLHNTQFKSFFR